MLKKQLFLLLVCIASVISAQNHRNYSNEFLTIGVDAASLGMSNSVVATTSDVNAMYWNPAGLAKVDDYQGSLMHASYFANIAAFNYIGFAMPIDEKSSLGMSVTRFGVDDILNTTELIDQHGNVNYQNISLFSAADYAFTVSYARNVLIKDLHVGVTSKVIRRIIGDFATSWGFGFDLGLQYKFKNWNVGFIIRDVTTTYNTWSIDSIEFEKIKNAIPGENQELPESIEITKPKLQLGFANQLTFSERYHLTTEIDFHVRFAETNDILSSSSVSMSPSFGFQLDYDKMVFLRGGVGNIQNITNFDDSKSVSVQPNFGIGFKYKGIQLDYALTNIGSIGNALYSNIFSIKFDYSFFRKFK